MNRHHAIALSELNINIIFNENALPFHPNKGHQHILLPFRKPTKESLKEGKQFIFFLNREGFQYRAVNPPLFTVLECDCDSI